MQPREYIGCRSGGLRTSCLTTIVPVSSESLSPVAASDNFATNGSRLTRIAQLLSVSWLRGAAVIDL